MFVIRIQIIYEVKHLIDEDKKNFYICKFINL
jgi:hypothetical protein